jgi:uncharacterized membrane protein YqgA involved in biofilm formation
MMLKQYVEQRVRTKHNALQITTSATLLILNASLRIMMVKCVQLVINALPVIVLMVFAVILYVTLLAKHATPQDC